MALLVGACTAVRDLSGELDDAAPPVTSGAPGPTQPGGGAAAPAGPVEEIELTRGQPGSVELDDGARLTVPAGAVLAERARVRLARQGPGSYEPMITGEWQGRAEVRLPAGPSGPQSSSFLLSRAGAGWAVQEAESAPNGFLHADLASLAPVRSLSCPAAVATDAAGVLACLSQAGVAQLPPTLQAQLAGALGCGGAWPPTGLLSRDAACASTPNQQVVPPPSSASPPEQAAEAAPEGGGALQVAYTENPVGCDGTRRPFGTVSGALPGETLSFSAAGIGELRAGVADDSGSVTAHWRCDPPDAGRSWSLTATGLTSGRSVSFPVTGGGATLSPAAVPPAPNGGLQVALAGAAFPCDGGRHPAGTLSGAQPGERVTFSAPGIGPLLPGTADAAGNLTVHWRCDPVHTGWTWSVSATGESSGRTGAFSLVGG